MKKRINVLLISTLVLTIGSAFAFSEMAFDFIAPSVPNTSDAPNQVGLIVHQTSDDSIQARTSAGWVQLNNDANADVPTGTVLPYVGTTAPTGYIICNGAALSRTTYSNLYSVIGDQFGEGDGSTTFNLPDLRGKFIRGWDNSAGNDPDASTRTTCATGGSSGDNIGSCQADELKSHSHNISARSGDADQGSFVDGNAGQAQSGLASTESSGGSETRPINVTLNYIIKL